MRDLTELLIWTAAFGLPFAAWEAVKFAWLVSPAVLMAWILM